MSCILFRHWRFNHDYKAGGIKIIIVQNVSMSKKLKKEFKTFLLVIQYLHFIFAIKKR